jgi:hypothetical protein
MALEPEPVPARDLALEDLERVDLELDHLPARAADEVIVMLTVVRRLVALRVAGDDRAPDEARLGEKRERAVDGRLRAADPARPEIRDEVLDRVVPGTG